MTKLKIAVPAIHKSRLRQIARTGHEIYYFDDDREVEKGYNSIFDEFTKELNNIEFIAKNDFVNNPTKYDLIILPNQASMHEFSSYSNLPKAFIWTNVCDINDKVKKFFGNNPLMICTSNNWKLRPQDRTVTIGVDPEEFPERDFEMKPISRILAPINNFVHVGKNFAKKHRNSPNWFGDIPNQQYFCELVGYDWVDTLSNNEYIKICGRNPVFKEETLISREQYKKWIRLHSSILIPSRFKHHANATAEALMSKQALLIRPSVEFRVNSSPLTDEHDCFIIKTEDELRKYYCNDGWVYDRKRQEAIAENALLTAHQYFSMDTCVERWNEFFEHVVDWQ